jgi:hypothetical protein
LFTSIFSGYGKIMVAVPIIKKGRIKEGLENLVEVGGAIKKNWKKEKGINNF